RPAGRYGPKSRLASPADPIPWSGAVNRSSNAELFLDTPLSVVYNLLRIGRFGMSDRPLHVEGGWLMRGLARIAVVFACTVLAPAVAFAQATITGTVKDTSGAVLPGVTVEEAIPALIEKVRTATTVITGHYSSVSLLSGTYST